MYIFIINQVGELRAIADTFNEQLKKYKKKSNSIERFMDCIYVDKIVCYIHSVSDYDSESIKQKENDFF